MPEDPEEEDRWKLWSMQDGYTFAHGEHNENMGKPGEDLPRRGIAPGLHMGLSVLMDVQEEEYYCSGTESVGFKVGPTYNTSLRAQQDLEVFTKFASEMISHFAD